jgi:hypothetical protein
VSPAEQHEHDRTLRWSTYPNSRTVLAVAHNTTAATRLFDTLGVLAGDPRIRIVFSRTGSSAFDTDTSDFLARRGVLEIPWDTAVATRFDMAISASYGGELHRIQAPLVVVPHGMGYNKYLNKEQRTKNKEQRSSVFGLSSEWLVHDGRVVPSTIVLSHAEQRERLRRDCPAAVSRTLIAGDICFDRLQASTALRASYRRAFGLAPHHRLVVVSSTWGPDSLLAADADLPRALTCALPADEYRVTLALHPNIHAHHSRWQVSEYLSGAARAGAHVPDDVDQWRAAIVAADLVVGDHGSVPFYAAALGVPLLLATAPAHTVDPASPIAKLLAVAPRLDPDADPAEQLRAAIRGHDPARYAAITALTTGEPGCGARILRTAMYETMGLPEPDEPADIDALPLPSGAIRGPDAHIVHVTLDAGRTATILRYPAERLRAGPAPGPGTHLAVGVHEPRIRWLRLADVVIGVPGVATERWIETTLASLPGCALAAAPEAANRWLLGDGKRLLRVTGSDHAARLFGSAAYHLVARGAALAALAGDWTIRCGGETSAVTVAAA